jgi:hypothetical protein
MADMPTLVCTGATLQCSFGMAPATFTASGAHVTATAAGGVVTDTSSQAVPAFGSCMSLSNPQVASASSAAGTLTPQPCQPVVTGPWTPGSESVRIGDVAALDDASTLTCSWGGVITVSAAGQEEVEVR